VGTVTAAWVSSGGQFWNALLAQHSMPAFTGSYTISLHLSGAPGSGVTWFPILRFWRSSDSTACREFSPTIAGTTTDWTFTETVNGTPSQWHCLNWDQLRLYNGLSDNIPNGVSWTLTVNAAGLPANPACEYGAQPNPSSQISTAVNLELMLAVCAALGLAPEAILFWGFMMGWPLIVPICSTVPNLPDPLTNSDFIDGTFIPNPLSIPKFIALFEYGLWGYYCQCSPAPTGSPPPVQPSRPSMPTRITNITVINSVCSNADICTYLTRITQLIVSINLQINQNTYLSASSRYALGTSHTGLSGNGELAVSGILGAFVSFTTLPNRIGYLVGDPNVLYDVGFVTFGSPDGWYPPQNIDHNPWLTLPQHMSNVTKIGYSIPADVVLTLTELVPQQLSIPQGP
jgi:hypothetical protein